MELPNRPTKDPYREIPVKDFSYINTQKNLPKKTGTKWGWIISGLVVLLLLGGGAYLYGRATKDNDHNSNKASSKTTSQTKAKTTG